MYRSMRSTLHDIPLAFSRFLDPLSLALLTTTLILAAFYILSTLKSRTLPPGPRGLPLFGNALDMSSPHPWIKYTDWAKQYGDIVYFSAVGQPVVILNSAQTLFDLLDGRSAIYSDRPRLVMGGELAGYNKAVPLTPYGPRLREYRKLMFDILAPKKVVAFQSLETKNARIFMASLLRDPDELLGHIRRNVSNIVFNISHGYELQETDDPMLAIAQDADRDFSEASTAGAYLIDSFPSLCSLPRWFAFGWMKKEKIYRRNMERLRDIPWNFVKDQVTRGVASSSFTSRLIEGNPNPSEEQEDIYKWASMALYSGGADTTVASNSAFFFAMKLFPEVQQKAYDEILSVIGPSRFPEFSDRPNLPYLDNLIKEIHRLNPVAPTAVPHRSTKDDWYRGYFIPEGTMIIPNTWSVLHDPEVYPLPFDLRPERYDDLAAQAKGLNPDPRKFVFGYGRRICPGQHMAEESLFISVTTTLACFKILPPTDQERKMDFSKSEGFMSGTIVHPEPFTCKLIPRSQDIVDLIQSTKS